MRLAASLRYLLYATTAMVFASGVLWLAPRFLLALSPLPEGFATGCMRVHGGAAMVLLVLIGWAASLHAPSAWRERRNLVSGILLSAALVLLAATGYCLYYLGEESGRAASSLGHWLLGLALPVALIWHVWLGQRNGAQQGVTKCNQVVTSPSDVAAATEKNPENATAASGVRR